MQKVNNGNILLQRCHSKVRFKVLTVVMLGCCIVSCSRSYDNDTASQSTAMDNRRQTTESRMENSLKTANKVMNLKEKESISAYFSRQNIPLKEYHGVYIATNNKSDITNVINENCTVEIEYSAMIMGADNEKFSEPRIAKVNTNGDTEIAFGLIDALKVLKQGAEVFVAVPSVMNYVINDEGEKIESKYTVIYKVHVGNIVKNK